MGTPLHVAFVHPDLGIGGGERLVIDAALCLQRAGHKVTIFTLHHDRSHCFEETRDGTLQVREYGNVFPFHIGGRLRAAFTVVNMALLAVRVALRRNPFDIVFCDLVAHVIPVLRLVSRAKIIFYCHYPDLLLARSGGWLYLCYRAPINRLEETGLAMADLILANSRFTASEFRKAFPRLQSCIPEVLYPGIETAPCDDPRWREQAANAIPTPEDDGEINLLCISRFERKKNVRLALEAVARLRERLRAETWARTRLIILGGYNERWREHRETLSELRIQARNLNLQDHVFFEPSCSDERRLDLLFTCCCVLYTPENEHLGLVPLEAMAAGKPVIGVNSGGPLETIRHGETGFLCNPTPDAFADALERLIQDPDLRACMGRAGSRHVAQHFSRDAFSTRLDSIVRDSARPR